MNRNTAWEPSNMREMGDNKAAAAQMIGRAQQQPKIQKRRIWLHCMRYR